MSESHTQSADDRFLQLISGYFDGSLAQEEFDELCSLILASNSNARKFAKVAALHGGIRTILQQEELKDALKAGDLRRDLSINVDPENIVNMLDEVAEADNRAAIREAKSKVQKANAERQKPKLDRQIFPRQFKVPRRAYWAAMAASLAVVAVFSSSFLNPQVDPELDAVALVSSSVDARWSGPAKPIGPTQRLFKETMVLEAGVVEITMEDGAIVVCEAPIEFQIDSGNEIGLKQGSLVAKVPKNAIGFTVTTQGGAIVDLGTEFGVSVSGEGTTSLKVFDGAVALSTKDAEKGASPITLSTGETTSFDADGVVIQEIALIENDFLRVLPSTAYELAILQDRPAVYWRFRETGPTIQSVGRLQLTSEIGAGVNLSCESHFGLNEAVRFAGEHAGVLLSKEAELELSREFTIECWVKPSAIQNRIGAMRIISNFYGAPSGYTGYSLGIADGGFVRSPEPKHVIVFTKGGSYDSVSADSIVLDEWLHVVVTVDEKCVPSMYANGSKTIVNMKGLDPKDVYRPFPNNSDFSSSSSKSISPFTIGRHPIVAGSGPPPEAWQGSIDELAIFDRVLTAQEILDHYQAGVRSGN